MAKREQSKSINGWRVLLEDESTGYKRVLIPVKFLWEHRADYNPRKPITQGERFYSDLSASIQDYGLVEDPIFNIRLMHLVGGEQRVHLIHDQDPDAMVPAVLIDCENEEEEMHLCVTLNRLHGEFDDVKLADVFTQLKADIKFPSMKVTGFDLDDIGAIMHRFVEEAPNADTAEKNVVCPHCGHVGPEKEFVTDDTEPCPGREKEGGA